MFANFLPNVFVEDEDEKKKAFKLLEEISPITYIENLQRPMSIIQYTEDERMPIEQTRTFVQKLNDIHSNNIPFKFIYKELKESHYHQYPIDLINEMHFFMSSPN